MENFNSAVKILQNAEVEELEKMVYSTALKVVGVLDGLPLLTIKKILEKSIFIIEYSVPIKVEMNIE